MLVLEGVPQRRSVDIVVLGDAGAGKTSLITTLVSSIFPEAVPRVLQQVRVPPEETADNIALSITDTSSDEPGASLRQAATSDVVVLVYALDCETSWARVKAHWLPEIAAVFRGPIVVVGNKSDLVQGGEERAESMRRRVEPLLHEFRQVDACWECSAKLNMNVLDVFGVAQQAVVYPLAPLYDTQTRALLPKFKTALKRVFRIFDQDRDGVLSDVELNDFQETCFGARLQPSDIKDVKTMLQSDGGGRVASFGITFEGFLSIHKRFIDRNRTETSWLVLRQFGYDDSLDLQVPVGVFELAEAPGGWLQGPRDRSVELTKAAITFLADLFHRFDEDKDQALSPEELANLFAICPGGLEPWAWHAPQQSAKPPAREDGGLLDALEALQDPGLGPPNSVLCSLHHLPRGTRVDAKGNATLAGWLAQWALLTLLQPRITLLYLYFLGFDRRKEPAVTLTRPRKVEDAQNSLQRAVVRALVFGANGVGKGALLDALADPTGASAQPLRPNGSAWALASEYAPNSVPEEVPAEAAVRSAAARVRCAGDGAQAASKYLCLTKVPPEQAAVEEALSRDMVDCDLAVLMFDSTDPSSVDWLRGVQRRIPESVPCVYLASKVDLLDSALEGEPAGSEAVRAAEALCEQNSLPHPELVSLSAGSTAKFKTKMTRLFELLLSAALKPDAARPISEERRAAQRRRRLMRATLRLSLVASVAFSAGLFLWTWGRGAAPSASGASSGSAGGDGGSADQQAATFKAASSHVPAGGWQVGVPKAESFPTSTSA